MDNKTPEILIAARSGELSLYQANIVKNALSFLKEELKIIKVATKGDIDRVSPLTKIGGNGLFVVEIEKYLLDKKADIAVHSGKDLPYKLSPGLVIAGTPEAGDSRDCIIFRKGKKNLKNIKIGTGSPRRIAECKKFYPSAEFSNIRGNVLTRLKKLENGEYDAIILAKAGLDRIKADLSGFDTRVFSAEEFIPSACQGIIAAECREEDLKIKSALEKISDRETKARFTAERYMASILGADCGAPLGVYSEINNENIKIDVMYNGKRLSERGKLGDYKEICDALRTKLYE